jgi:sugar lactone lactonase YvrE
MAAKKRQPSTVKLILELWAAGTSAIMGTVEIATRVLVRRNPFGSSTFQAMRWIAVAALSVPVALGACGPRGPAALSWTEARRAGRLARDAKDDVGYRAALAQLYDMSGSVSLLRELAAVDVRLGERQRALAELSQLASEGEGVDLDEDQALAGLRTEPAWAALVQRMRENRKPVTRARPFAALPVEDLVAEDITHDPVTNTFFVSSVRRRKILAVDGRTGSVRELVREGEHGVSGIFGVAAHGGRLWATTADLPVIPGHDPRAPRPTGVLAFDIGTGALLERVDLPAKEGKHALTDLTATDDGLFVSDAEGGAVYFLRYGGHALEPVTPPGALVSPQTPVLSANGQTVFVPDYVRGIAAVRLGTRTITWFARAPGVALTGIDGLYLMGDGFLAMQNGTTPPRVTRFFVDLAPDAPLRVLRVEVLERATPGLREPTHGVRVGGDFYFLVATGWDRFDDEGNPKPGATPDAPAIWTMPVR